MATETPQPPAAHKPEAPLHPFPEVEHVINNALQPFQTRIDTLEKEQTMHSTAIARLIQRTQWIQTGLLLHLEDKT
jgi:hypothetical protein